MKFKKQFIGGEISGTGYKEKSIYNVVYDEEKAILHIFDDSHHRSTSIINQMSYAYIDDVLQAIGVSANHKKVRCIIYQTSKDSTDPIDSVISEYNEDKGDNPFIHLDNETVKDIGYEPFYNYIYKKDVVE